MDILKERVFQAFRLTYDFYSSIDERCLPMTISGAPSNTIGEQAYCIIGARESYLKALKIGEWSGFDCSLIDSTNKSLIVSKLEETLTNLERFFQENRTGEINTNLLIDLLEHEVQHHGQLIRYAYANKIDFPGSWNRRYTV